MSRGEQREKQKERKEKKKTDNQSVMRWMYL